MAGFSIIDYQDVGIDWMHLTAFIPDSNVLNCFDCCKKSLPC